MIIDKKVIFYFIHYNYLKTINPQNLQKFRIFIKNIFFKIR